MVGIADLCDLSDCTSGSATSSAYTVGEWNEPDRRQWMTITGAGRCFIASGVGLGAVLMPCPLEGLDLDAIPEDLTQWNPESKDRPLTIGELWGELRALRAEVAALRSRLDGAQVGP